MSRQLIVREVVNVLIGSNDKTYNKSIYIGLLYKDVFNIVSPSFSSNLDIRLSHSNSLASFSSYVQGHVFVTLGQRFPYKESLANRAQKGNLWSHAARLFK